MSTPTPENNFGELWTQAIESHLRDMPDDQLQQLIAKVRGVGFNQQDPGARQQAILNSIAAKQAKRPAVDHNGQPITPPPPPQPNVQTDPNYLNKVKGYSQ